MEMHTDDRLKTSKRPFQKGSQVTHLYFLLRIGLVLLACCITMIAVVYPTYGRTDTTFGKKQGNGKKQGKMKKNVGKVTLDGDGENLQATLQSLTLSGLPKNAPLIIHIHAKNTKSNAPADICKGPVLFQITQGLKSDGQGKFSLAKGDTKAFVLNSGLTDAQKQALLKAKDLNTWLLNIHDAAIAGKDIDPKTGKPKPISVACGPLNKNGIATLKVTQVPAGAPALN